VRAVRYYVYGPAEVLVVEDVLVPALAGSDILVRVCAASVNPLNFHYLRGRPYLVRAVSGLWKPRVKGLGADMAAVVEAIGKEVTRFRVGDEVFGGRSETFAEYVRLPQDGVVERKPLNLTFEQAASAPVAAVTALQALRDKARVRAGQKVLINGDAGGVGAFAVQLAKAFGAEVTGVCSTAEGGGGRRRSGGGQVLRSRQNVSRRSAPLRGVGWRLAGVAGALARHCNA
jgi:NADPH:quinone reductase-like Zn-dependent oxidoreductase